MELWLRPRPFFTTRNVANSTVTMRWLLLRYLELSLRNRNLFVSLPLDRDERWPVIPKITHPVLFFDPDTRSCLRGVYALSQMYYKGLNASHASERLVARLDEILDTSCKEGDSSNDNCRTCDAGLWK